MDAGGDKRRGPKERVRQVIQRATGAGIAITQWIGPRWVPLLILITGAAVAIISAAAAAEVYDAVSEGDDAVALDGPTLDLMISIREPWLNAIVAVYSRLGHPAFLTLLAVCGMALFALRRRSWTPLVITATASAGALLMMVAGKEAVGRRRPPLSAAVPPLESSPSFPSGHAILALVAAGTVAYVVMLHRRGTFVRVVAVVLAVAFALTMGLSRVYLGQHWLTDVLAAWTLGLAWLAIVITAHRLLLSRQNGKAKR